MIWKLRICIYIRVGKTGSLGPWSRVIVYFSKLSFCQKWSLNGRIILAKGKLATIHFDSAPRSQRSCFAHPNLHIHKVVLLGINIALVCKVSQSVMSKVLNKLRNFQKTQLGQHLYEEYLFNYQTFTHRFKLILNTCGKTLFFVAHKLFWHCRCQWRNHNIIFRYKDKETERLENLGSTPVLSVLSTDTA